MRKRKANTNAIVDSNENQHDGDIYKAGKLQTIYSYSKVLENTVYYKGTKQTVQGYSDVNNGNAIYYSTSSGYKTGESRTARYNYNEVTKPIYDANGNLLNADETYFYGGAQKTLYERGSQLTSVKGWKRADDEENWSYTPIGSAANSLYERQPDDDYQVTLLGEKCSLQLSELSTKNVSALITSVATEE